MGDTGKDSNSISRLLYELLYAFMCAVAALGQLYVYMPAIREKLDTLYAQLPRNAEAAETTAEGIPGFQLGVIYALIILAVLGAAYVLSRIILFSLQTRIGAAVIITGSMICIMIMQPAAPEISRLTVAGLSCLVIMLTADVLRFFQRRREAHRLVFLAPVFLAAFLFLLLAPISDRPVDWSGVVRICERIADRGKLIVSWLDIGTADYSGSETGFDGSGSIFGNPRDKKEQTLALETKNMNIGATYLTGRIFSDFDGRNWGVNGASGSIDRNIDTLETLSAVYETYPNNPEDVIRYGTYHITVKDIKTMYAFGPSKVTESPRSTPALQLYAEGDNLLFDKKRRYGFEYDISGYILNHAGAELAKYHREIDKDTWDECASEHHRPEGGVYTYGELTDYRSAVGEIYGQAPECGESLKELITDISYGHSAPAEDDVYIRLRNIEEWLSEHDYRTDVSLPEEVDSEEDFLRFFLTEKTEGYCSYYATAFVLMSRAVGIPARYVQGYRVPKNAYVSVKVTSDMAHAWPEAYIKGVGWIPFEPTPGFKSVKGWGGVLYPPEYYETEGTSTEDPESDPYYGYEPESDHDDTDITDEEEALREQERLRDEERQRRRLLVTIAVTVALSILILIVTVLLVRFISGEVRFRRLTGRDLYLEICRRCMFLLKCLGALPAVGETLGEFGFRIADMFGEEAVAFIAVYERLLYGRGSDIHSGTESEAHTAPETDVEEKLLRDNYALLRKRLRESMGTVLSDLLFRGVGGGVTGDGSP